jgi:hypothetical protein
MAQPTRRDLRCYSIGSRRATKIDHRRSRPIVLPPARRPTRLIERGWWSLSSAGGSGGRFRHVVALRDVRQLDEDLVRRCFAQFTANRDVTDDWFSKHVLHTSGLFHVS